MRGPETQKSHQRRLNTKFYDIFMQGHGLDIGYRGERGGPEVEPVLPTAVGVDLDYEGYDGVHLPLEDHSQNYVFASHILEHVQHPVLCLREWHRVLKLQGHMIIVVPHKYLYERKKQPPSHWNKGHLHFYTPAGLLETVEKALEPNTYRIVYFRDEDFGYKYDVPLDHHPHGEFSICCVLRKMRKPEWDLE